MTKALLKAIFISVFCFVNVGFVMAESIEDLKINKFVNDYADVISESVELELEQLLQQNFASTSNQVLVVTVNDMSGDYIENYSIKLAEKIKAGSAKNDNGVIFLVAKEERKIRIEVGYGLEGELTDQKSGRIINEIVAPAFKSEDYESGIMSGVKNILSVINGAEYTDRNTESENIFKKSSAEQILSLAFMSLFFVLPWLAAILGRTKSWWLGGVIGLIAAGLLFVFLIKTLFVFLLIAFGALFDYVVSKNYKESVSKRKDPDWWAGGGWGPGSSGGWNNSSGGFGGGGGSFGGGGASGSW